MRERLIEIFKRTNYKQDPNLLDTLTANLANQFTEYALNSIAEQFIENGVVVLPCKVGDKVYYITAWDEYADQNDHEQEVQRIRITRHETYFDLSLLLFIISHFFENVITANKLF